MCRGPAPQFLSKCVECWGENLDTETVRSTHEPPWATPIFPKSIAIRGWIFRYYARLLCWSQRCSLVEAFEIQNCGFMRCLVDFVPTKMRGFELLKNLLSVAFYIYMMIVCMHTILIYIPFMFPHVFYFFCFGRCSLQKHVPVTRFQKMKMLNLFSDEKSTGRLTMLDLRLIFPDSFCSGCVIDTRRSGGTVTRPARCQDTYLFRLGIRMDHLFCWDFVAEREGEQKRNLKCFLAGWTNQEP